MHQRYFGFYLYQIILRLIFIPLIKRYFNNIIRDAPESLVLFVPSINCKLYFGTNQRSIRTTNHRSNNKASPVIIFFHNPISFCFRILLDPKIGLGEAYMFEDWDVQTRIQDLLALLIRAKRYNKSKKIKCTNGWLEELLNLFIYSTVQLIRSIISFINTLQHYYHANSLRGSAQNIREHYDLGNDMFSIFLDPSMTYSCATFQSIPHTVTHSDNELLEEAQMRKYDQIFDELNLKSNDRILEIGCGWGACAIRAVKCYGCQWTGLTISTEQFKIAQQRITDNGVADKVNIKLLDYRLEKDIYDKVIVIEMIEAVGHEYLPQFFETLRDRLCPGGKAYLQAITCPEIIYERYCRSSDFIKKYIFPGGHMPSERAIIEALPPELTIKKTVHIGQHYGPTLDLWYCAWMEHEERILKLGYSKKFHRKWQYYFQLCSTLFRYSYIDTVQLLIEKSL